MASLRPHRRLDPRRWSWAAAFALLVPALAIAGDLDAREWNAKVDKPTSTPAKPTAKDFAIPFPANFGGGGEALYPSTPSQFAAIGKNAFDNDVRQVWDLSTKKMVGGIKGRIGWDDKTIALSPDGQYLAGKPTFRKAIEVRTVKNGRQAQTFDVESPFLDFVDFAAGDRVIYGRLQDRKLEISDIKTGDKVVELTLTREAERESVAFSPGRAYMAASERDGNVRVYDLSTGLSVCEAPAPKQNGQAIKCEGLMYSPDGAELAGVFEFFGARRIVAWDAATGKSIADFDLGKEIQKPPFYNGRGIDWFPDKSAWLVAGNAVIDRSSGQKVWAVPFEGNNMKPGPRQFLTAETLLVVTGNGNALTLRTSTLPRDKIAGAAEIAKSGGNIADAALPPLTPADVASAKRVDLSARAAWTVQPKVAAGRRLTVRPLNLKGKFEDYRAILFGPGDSTAAAVVGIPQRLGQPNPTDGQPRWVERFDLAGGKVLGRLDLPNVVDPIAVSPDGSLVLAREAKAKDRLDVFGGDGKPVAGWRPYEKESGERAVAWAAFLDKDRVLTLGVNGTLALWSLPKCKAIYLADDAFVGVPALSPDRSLIAGFDGRSLRVLDAETGAPRGEGAAPGGLGNRPEARALAFRPDGQEVIATFVNGSAARWDLKTGKIASQILPGLPAQGNAIEWAGNGHVLLDNHWLIELASRRPVWEYSGAGPGAGGSDGRHWAVVRGVLGQENARLVSVDTPDPSVEKAEALLADPKAPAVIRPGSKVSIALNLNGPPVDPNGYRQKLTEAIAAKLKANGLTVVEDGAPNPKPDALRVSYVRGAGSNRGMAPDARLVVTVREKPTGQTIQFRKMGIGRETTTISVVDLVCEMSLVDAKGTVAWMPPRTVGMQSFGIVRMTANETPEGHLKGQQWEEVKNWAAGSTTPYFVARDGNEVVRLPGVTDLNAAFMR